MFSNEQRPDRERGRRHRSDRGTARPALENLETRQLLAYTPFGYSLPQLAVTGYAAPSAAYGGSLAVDINVENLGASSLIEPTQLAPGSPSFADSPATTVNIYGSVTANAKAGYALLGTVEIPAIRQNSDYETVANIVLPARPAGFPKTGNLYLTLAVNNDRSILQSSSAANVYHVPKPVAVITDALPDLQVVGFDVPTTLQPGNVIAPTIRIENFGVGDPATQGPVTVALVASLDKKFGVGDAVVSSFTIADLPGISSVPTQTTVSAIQNLFTTPNEFTITLPAFQLPTSPGFYYLGIKIDPTHQINQTYGPTNNLDDVISVGPASQFLNPSTVLIGSVAPVFPNLPVTFVNTSGLGQTPIITPVNTAIVTTPTPTPTPSPITAFAVTGGKGATTKVSKAKAQHHKA